MLPFHDIDITSIGVGVLRQLFETKQKSWVTWQVSVPHGLRVRPATEPATLLRIWHQNDASNISPWNWQTDFTAAMSSSHTGVTHWSWSHLITRSSWNRMENQSYITTPDCYGMKVCPAMQGRLTWCAVPGEALLLFSVALYTLSSREISAFIRWLISLWSLLCPRVNLQWAVSYHFII